MNHHRHIESKAKKEYKQRVKIWELYNQAILFKTRIKINEWLKQGKVLNVHLYHCFEQSRIITKSKPHRPQRLDAGNRNKVAIDLFFDLLGVDDKYIFTESATKLMTPNGGQECTMIVIEPIDPKTKCKTLSMIKTETTEAST